MMNIGQDGAVAEAADIGENSYRGLSQEPVGSSPGLPILHSTGLRLTGADIDDGPACSSLTRNVAHQPSATSPQSPSSLPAHLRTKSDPIPLRLILLLLSFWRTYCCGAVISAITRYLSLCTLFRRSSSVWR